MKKVFLNRIVGIAFFIYIIASCLTVEAKQADLAGSWYSDSPEILKTELEKYLREARIGKIDGTIVGLIVPHAGYRYSGEIMAYSYKVLKEIDPELVIVVGFTHRRYMPGKIAVLTDEYFLTPLGKAFIDKDITEKLIAYDERIESIPEAFSHENSVEMQIPFIQTAVKNAKLVLISLTDQRAENTDVLADALYNILSDKKNFVLLASTDMSHYHSYDKAIERDAVMIDVIKSLDAQAFYSKSIKADNSDRMCGFGAVYAVMTVSKKLGANNVEILKYANSGDTAGRKDRVVGYLSAAFVKDRISKKGGSPLNKEEESMFSREQKIKLLRIARDTIKYYLETGKKLEVNVDDALLKEDMGAFVTIHKDGRLRGCIGSMTARGPLYLTVRDMAIAAATEDPRFPVLSMEELEGVDIEVSALTPMKKIDDPNMIEMGKHGVMVKKGFRSGVYLPQVADETGWNRDQFMNSLCAQKAGIPANAWKSGACDIYIFTAEVFGEKEEL